MPRPWFIKHSKVWHQLPAQLVAGVLLSALALVLELLRKIELQQPALQPGHWRGCNP